LRELSDLTDAREAHGGWRWLLRQLSDEELADVGGAAIAMTVGARGSLDLIHAESDRRAKLAPRGATVPYSVVKVAVRAERERCVLVARPCPCDVCSARGRETRHTVRGLDEFNAPGIERGIARPCSAKGVVLRAARFFLPRECAPEPVHAARSDRANVRLRRVFRA
jgi:hypothetical protein